MHPPLAEHRHEACAQVVAALKDCHDRNPYLKFLGLCNDEKHALNMCLRTERLERTKENSQKAKEKRKEVEKRWKEIEQDS
ncbi:hypothetical protein JCM21900_002366 [Sporobolomyces salmonicolor]